MHDTVACTVSLLYTYTLTSIHYHKHLCRYNFKGVGSKIGVVRPGGGEVNVAVLCAKAVRVDGYLSIISESSLARQYTTAVEDI